MKLRALAGWAVSACLILGGCAAGSGKPAAQRFSTSFLGAMDTLVQFTAYCESSGQFDAAAELVRQELERLDKLFDLYDADSELNRLHAAAGQTAVAVSPDTSALLSRTLALQRQVGGVNIAMGRVLALWHTARETGELPEPAALEQALAHSDAQDVIVDGRTVRLADPELRLDLGGVAKGYAAQVIRERLTASGVTTFLLDCGTSTLVCAGTPPDKNGWTVAVRNPDASLNLSGAADPAPFLGTIAITDGCVGVSGDYQKYFYKNGVYYSHIVEEATGRPARHVRMVCVLTADAFLSDYYATALFALPFAQARQVAESTPSLEALWMFPDGSLYKTDGFILNVE